MIPQIASSNTIESHLSQLQTTGKNRPLASCVHDLVERQVIQTPGVVAVTCGDYSITYRELNSRANQLARSLQELTTGMDVPVGICMEHSIEMVIGILAILKAGAAYLPLDPAYPRDLLLYMLERALAPVILTQESVLDSLPETKAARICVKANGEASPENVPRRIAPGNLARVAYSSGCTSLPRAVAMPHRPLVNLLR